MDGLERDDDDNFDGDAKKRKGSWILEETEMMRKIDRTDRTMENTGTIRPPERNCLHPSPPPPSLH